METVSKIKKKMGRPAKAVKKEVRACVRFSRHEYFIIREKAREAGVKTSEYIRQTAIKAKIITRINAEELHFVRQLVGMANNLNQVAKVCNREEMFEAMQYFESYRNQVDEVLKKLRS
jgi:Bacterial mobilisation protein (MobC)